MSDNEIIGYIVFAGIIVVVIMFILPVREDKIRCHSCGHRGFESDFYNGRCPSCSSLEL